MSNEVDQRLVELCRRDEIIAVRDEAKRAAEQGDAQAGYVAAWMEQLLGWPAHYSPCLARSKSSAFPRK